MKNLFTLKKAFFVFLLAVISNSIYSQNFPETVYKEWYLLGESTDHIDVSAQIVKCDAGSQNQVLLLVFNEGAENKNGNFSITITDNGSNESFTKTISYDIPLATIHRSDCGSTENEYLKIDLPANYNAGNISISVQFN